MAFITGATGSIGTALTRRLSSLGWRVIALVRDKSRAGHLSSLPDVELLVGDPDEVGAKPVESYDDGFDSGDS